MTTEFLTTQRINQPYLYADGCLPRVASFTSENDPLTVLISPGRVRDSTDRFDLYVESTLTLSFTTPALPGINKIDRIMPSPIPDGTWFAIYIIGSSLNQVRPQSIAVPVAPGTDYTNAVAAVPPPRLPYDASLNVTYDVYRHVGWCSFYTNPYTLTGTCLKPFATRDLGVNFRKHDYNFKYLVTSAILPASNTFMFETGTFNKELMPGTTSCYFGLTIQSVVVDGYIAFIDTGTNPTLPAGETIGTQWPFERGTSTQFHDGNLAPFWSPGLSSYGLGRIIPSGNFAFSLYVKDCDYVI